MSIPKLLNFTTATWMPFVRGPYVATAPEEQVPTSQCMAGLVVVVVRRDLLPRTTGRYPKRYLARDPQAPSLWVYGSSHDAIAQISEAQSPIAYEGPYQIARACGER